MWKWSRLKARMYSIRNQIIVSILFFLVIPFLLTFYFMDKPLERVIEQKIGRSTQDALYLVNFNVQLFLEEMLQSSVNITIQPSISKLLKEPEAYSKYEKLRLNDTVLNRLFSSYFSNTYVTLFDRQGNWISTSYMFDPLLKGYLEADWYKEMMDKPYQLKWMFNNKELMYADHNPLITLVKTITEPQSNQNSGMILFSVREEDIRKYLTGLEGETYLIDAEGTIVSSPDKHQIGRNLNGEAYMSQIRENNRGQHIFEKNGEKWIVNYDTVRINGWKILQLVPYDTVFKEIFELRKTNLLIFFAIFIVFSFITISIAYSISKPLKLLRKKMRDLEDKEYHSNISVTGPQEISSLIETYNKMVKKIRSLLARVKEEYEQKEDMRFRALQAQINPHFLLNTLNNIKWMAYIRHDREVGDMLSNLGGILEGSIGRGGVLITLRQELDYIGNYIALMKMSHPEPLTVNIEVPEELMDQEVINIMLQPIIENCLVHGLQDMAGKGCISMKAWRDGDDFVLQVSDNGAGVTPEKLEELRSWLESGVVPERIGIKNVHERIRLQYGESYGISLESQPGEGTRVEYRLPIREIQKGIGHGNES